MNTLLFSLHNIDWTMVILFMAAWFIQLGFHEGGHAIVADRLGDGLPRSMGRVTLNPFKHIEWNNFWSIFGGVIMPLLFTLQGNLPLGFAWVWTTRGTPAHNAKVALAGPVGSLVCALIGAIGLVGLFPFFESTPLLGTAFFALFAVGILYGLFNLLCPLPGVDAGEILYYFLPQGGRHLFDSIRPYSMILFVGVVWILPMVTKGEVSLFRYIHVAIGEAHKALGQVISLVWG